MPVYEFLCAEHGPFAAFRPMAAFADPCPCPHCGAASARVLLTPPRLAARDRPRIRAQAINEQAAHEPKRLARHGAGCTCCAGKRPSGRPALERPDGSRSFPTARPWMIGH